MVSVTARDAHRERRKQLGKNLGANVKNVSALPIYKEKLAQQESWLKSLNAATKHDKADIFMKSAHFAAKISRNPRGVKVEFGK